MKPCLNSRLFIIIIRCFYWDLVRLWRRQWGTQELSSAETNLCFKWRFFFRLKFNYCSFLSGYLLIIPKLICTLGCGTISCTDKTPSGSVQRWFSFTLFKGKLSQATGRIFDSSLVMNVMKSTTNSAIRVPLP